MDDRCIHGMLIYKIKEGIYHVSCSLCNKEYQSALAKRNQRSIMIGEPADRKTLRWLSENCTIRASVPKWSEEEFISNYQNIKGKKPEFNEFVRKHGATSKENKNWYDMSVSFSSKKEEELVFNEALNLTRNGSNTVIFNCDFVWSLLELGFDFGTNHSYKS